MPGRPHYSGGGGTVKKVITGNLAVAYGVSLSRPKVIAAYPITPQTTIIEYLAQFCAGGTLNARYIAVESEHSAMAASIGAGATGVRVFTASSSHGLAYMHEMLHVASYMRLPVVMAVVNRSMGIWNIQTDQTDSLAQRETGWMQFYCETGQEVLDTIIQAYRVSEQVLLPSMVILDAFLLSHTSEVVDIPDSQVVDAYLPEYKPQYFLNPEDPRSLGGSIVGPEYYMDFRYIAQQAMESAFAPAIEADDEFARRFGRRYGLVEEYGTDGAELVLVTSGTVSSTARIVIDELRGRGEKVGLLKVKLFRPFPKELVINALRKAKKVAVIDRNISLGQGGIFAEEIKSAFCNVEPKPLIYGFIAGLGGRDITPEGIHGIIKETAEADKPEEIIWVGVRE